MATGHILVVEDDKNIADLLAYNLEKNGFTSIIASTGEAVLPVLRKQHVDLILLDIILPGIDGFEVCKSVKQEANYSRIPVIFLTAKNSEADRVVGFELGAVDYVVKPFSVREIILRVKTMLKRGGVQEEKAGALIVGKLVVDLMRHQVSIDNRRISPTQMELKLLVFLMKRCGYVLTRDQFLDGAGEIGSNVNPRTIDTHIKRLRKKLGVHQSMIETVRGIGYRLCEDEEQ